MPNDSYEDFEDSANEKLGQIDSRDTYGSRFSVTTRRVAGSVSKNPRAAITKNQHRIKNSDRIFSRNSRRDDLGGGVNMSNINVAAETRLVNPKDIKSTKPGANNNDSSQPKKTKPSGLDSLFTSTVVEESPKTDQKQEVNDKLEISEPKITEETSSASSTAKIRRVERNKDTVEKYQPQGHNRKLKVIKPISYNSAKEVSSALKANCAVVLCLKNTNEETAKRLLDFSFGAAAMCGAKVGLEADKTFVITIGPGLSQREKLLCVKEGVPLSVENPD